MSAPTSAGAHHVSAPDVRGMAIPAAAMATPTAATTIPVARFAFITGSVNQIWRRLNDWSCTGRLGAMPGRLK
jgi:hypothetical protein